MDRMRQRRMMQRGGARGESREREVAYHSNAQLNRKVKCNRKPEMGSLEVNNK